MASGRGEHASPLRILLAERHARVRGALRADVEDAGHVVCAETSEAEAAVAAAWDEQPDVCLVEATLDHAPASLTVRLGAAAPGTRVVLLAYACESDEIADAFRHGAAGCIPMDVEAARLKAALATVARGERVVPPRVELILKAQAS